MTRLHAFSRGLRQLHVITWGFYWFTGTSVCPLRLAKIITWFSDTRWQIALTFYIE